MGVDLESLGGFVLEDEVFCGIIRARLQEQLHLTRNPDMFPGSQPVSFGRKHLKWLEEDDYYVCEKSDGLRFLLYYASPPQGPAAFLIDRSYRFRVFPGVTLPRRMRPREIQEETLLDGELVWVEGAGAGAGAFKFYIFDALMFEGHAVVGLPLPDRLKVVQNDVIGPWKEARGRGSSGKGEYPFELCLKQMWKPYGLHELFTKVIPSQKHENDGLIFTPIKDPYVAGTCHRMLKWKPAELNTLDFLVRRSAKGTWELHIATQGRPHYYADWDPAGDPSIGSGVDLDGVDGHVAEFQVHGATWSYMRLRDDKKLPNDSNTVEKVLHSIRDNVTREDLLSREQVIRRAWKERETRAGAPIGMSGSGSGGVVGSRSGGVVGSGSAGAGAGAGAGGSTSTSVGTGSEAPAPAQAQTQPVITPRSQQRTDPLWRYPLRTETEPDTEWWTTGGADDCGGDQQQGQAPEQHEVPDGSIYESEAALDYGFEEEDVGSAAKRAKQ